MIKDLFFPKTCFGCNSWGKYICHACRDYLLPPAHQRCIICQKPSLGGWTHPLCKSSSTPDRLLTIFDYQNKLVRQLINTAKLSLAYDIFIELTTVAHQRITPSPQLLHKFVLCPIPQSKAKLRQRGYNHSEIIAKIIEKNLYLAIDKILLKQKQTKEQKQLNKKERRLNLRNSFFINQPEYIPAKVMLVDDITTTGATFKEAAKVLLRAGAKTVWCLALAQD